MGPAGWPNQGNQANEHSGPGGAWFADDTTGRLGPSQPRRPFQRWRRAVALVPGGLWEEGLWGPAKVYPRKTDQEEPKDTEEMIASLEGRPVRLEARLSRNGEGVAGRMIGGNPCGTVGGGISNRREPDAPASPGNSWVSQVRGGTFGSPKGALFVTMRARCQTSIEERRRSRDSDWPHLATQIDSRSRFKASRPARISSSLISGFQPYAAKTAASSFRCASSSQVGPSL